MTQQSDKLTSFLAAQFQEHGHGVELEPGFWLLLSVPVADSEINGAVRRLLSAAPFPHESGVTEDDQWMLFYVDTASRAEAMHWLAEQPRVIRGEIRRPSPAQQALIQDLAKSNFPHRVSQRLGELHTNGEVSAGLIADPNVIRTLLDRLHRMEPLFYAAFLGLLSHNLLDLRVLLHQLMPEDINLENDIVRAARSQDPFLQSRQNAASDIRNFFLRFHVINPLDQSKNHPDTNPYASYLDIIGDPGAVSASVGGTPVSLPREALLTAIRLVRKNLYQGGKFSTFNTQMPWVTEEIAYPFRFIKAKVDAKSDVQPLDTLYMLERAVEG